MKTLQGDTSIILKEWIDGRYDVFYKFDGKSVSMLELYETATKTSFLPNEETKYYLEIILNS